MADQVEIRPSGPMRGSIRPPGSKSITNRAMVCAALAEGESLLVGALDCDDTRVMIEALRRLGIAVKGDSPIFAAKNQFFPATSLAPRKLGQSPVSQGGQSHFRGEKVILPSNVSRAAKIGTVPYEVRVAGRGGQLLGGDVELFAADSGTTARFLSAVAALGHGTYRIDGAPSIRRRPIGDLLSALGQLGGEAVSEAGNGCPPLLVRGRGLRGGRATVAGDLSSQFLSALLMAAPYAETDVELAVVGNLVSRPYVDMTLAVMASFGASVYEKEAQLFMVSAAQRYRARHYAIEPDATAAGYFFAAAAITQGEVTVEGLSRGSLQGDLTFCECLRRMGCEVRYDSDRVTVSGRPLHGIEIDMGAVSDTVPTLAAAALLAAGPTTIRGVGHIRHKESDRIGALAAELRKFGAEVEQRRDGLTIVPRPLHGAEVDPHDDHRLAMSLALVGLAVPGVIVRNPGCVAKTYPRYFHDLEFLLHTTRMR